VSTQPGIFCENCGTKNSTTGKFCSQCGQLLGPQAQTTLQPYPSFNRSSQQFFPADGGKLQSREAVKPHPIIIILSLVVVLLLISVAVLVFHQINQPSISVQPTSNAQTIPIGATITPTQTQVILSGSTATPTLASPYISWNSSHTDTSGGRPALTISGPAILEGDDTINGTFQGAGLAKEGTLIVLLDSTQYSVRSDNQGTEWAPVGGTPTRPQIDAEVGSIVNQMKSSTDTCSGGCSSIKVVYFQSGQIIDTKTL